MPSRGWGGAFPVPLSRARRLGLRRRTSLTLSAREARRLAGKIIAMIFQEPPPEPHPCFRSALNWSRACRPRNTPRGAAWARAVELRSKSHPGGQSACAPTAPVRRHNHDS